MEIIADYGNLKNDLIAKTLIDKFSEFEFPDSILYYNFPFYRGESKDDLLQAHVLFVSKEFGVIFFRCLEVPAIDENEKRKIDGLDSHIYARINKVEELRIKRRELKISVTPKIFVMGDLEPDRDDQDDLVNISNLKEAVLSNKKETLTDDEFKCLVAAIEGTGHLASKKDRAIASKCTSHTKGEILNIIQNLHTSFDKNQKRAALNIIDSPQRIRGLAGSGKTIILTMKAALYHMLNPDAEILYTYYTKALYGHIRYLIEKYYRDFSDNREPDWTKIHILHGWGGTGLKGVYSETCDENNIAPIFYLDARRANPGNPFEYIFDNLSGKVIKQKYDLTLIDEGQDFPASFYRVCWKLTKKGRIVWAYDDFQNIFDVNIQNEKETFGKDENGNYYVDFSKAGNSLQDIVLYVCYRNPRLALVSAFALGLGIYNDKVLQRLEDNNHWNDLGFVVEKGDSKDGCQMIISRPLENSPVETNELFHSDSVRIKIFNDLRKECEFVANEIVTDIKNQNLRPDDISVICLDNKHISIYFETIESILIQNNIKAFNLLNASNNNTYYTIDNHVTLSTLNKAKGNESGMVYIIGTDCAFQNKDYIIDRNKIFTAITRSKGWVVLTGFAKAEQCQKELEQLQANKYKFIFTQPSKRQTKTIFRGISKQQEKLNFINKLITELVQTGLSSDEVLKMLNDSNKKK